MTPPNDLTHDVPQLVLLTGHSGPIDSMGFSPDGRTLATGSYDGTVILWDLPTNSMRARLRGHGWNTRLAFSPDGLTLATVETNAIRLWETATGKWQGTLPGYTEPLAFASPSQLLAGGWRDELVRLDSESGKVLDRLVLVTDDPVRCANAISPDASTVVIAVYHGSTELLVWDLETSSLKRRRRVPETLWWKERDPETGKLDTTHGAQADVGHLAISPDNRLLAVGGTFTLWLCDLRTGKRTHLLLCGRDGTQSLAFSRSGKLLAAGTTSGAVKLWEIPSGREVQSLAAHRSWTRAVAFSPDGTLVASASHDKTIKIWHAETGKQWQSLPGPCVDVLAVTYSPDGQSLVSAHADGTLRSWCPLTGRLVGTVRPAHLHVAAVAFSPDNTSLASISHQWAGKSSASAVEFWDAASGQRRGFIDVSQERASGPIAFAADGSRIVVSRGGRDAATFVWDTRSQKLIGRVDGRYASVSPDGQLMATTAGRAGIIRLWDLHSLKLVREFTVSRKPDHLVALRFSPDGKVLVGGYAGFRVGVWEVADGHCLWEARTHEDAISAIAFSPDGTNLALGGSYGSVLAVWDFGARTQRLALAGHENNLRGADYSPGGQQLATASADGSVKLWDAATGRLLSTLLILPGTEDVISEEWITYTPSGHYAGSDGAHDFIHWKVGEELLPAEAFRAEFHRPERVAEALR